MKPRLFVKSYCGWCHEAEEWLDARGFEYQKLDVLDDPAAMAEMRALSGQTKTPTLEYQGEVLADFDVGQLEPWLNARGWPNPSRPA